jgi:transposase
MKHHLPLKLHRKRRSPEFKARVAMEATRGKRTIADLARQFEVHPVQVSNWKQRLKEQAGEAFNGPAARNAIRDRCLREIKLSQQLTHDEELWMMDVLQGRKSEEKVVNELAAALPSDVTGRLYWCVLNKPAYYRTRALAMLSHKMKSHRPPAKPGA